MIVAERASNVPINPFPSICSSPSLVTARIDSFGYVTVPSFYYYSDPTLLVEVNEPANKKQRCSIRDPPTKKKKCVRFAEQDEIINLGKPWTPDEIAASWNQPEDVARIKHHNRLCILALHKVGCKASRLPSNKYCIRGLEHLLSRQHVAMLRYMRQESIKTILIAQNAATPEQLRVLSERKSREKVKDAIKMAAKDSVIWEEEYRSFLL